MPTVAETNADLNASIRLQQVLAQVKASTAEPVVGRTQQVIEYTLCVKGVFGRNRKVKYQTFKLAVDQLGPLAQEELQVLVEAKLADVRVKDGNVKVYEQSMGLEAQKYGPDSPVYISRTFMVFSGKVLQDFDIVGGKVQDVMKAYEGAV